MICWLWYNLKIYRPNISRTRQYFNNLSILMPAKKTYSKDEWILQTEFDSVEERCRPPWVNVRTDNVKSWKQQSLLALFDRWKNHTEKRISCIEGHSWWSTEQDNWMNGETKREKVAGKRKDCLYIKNRLVPRSDGCTVGHFR